MLPSVHILSTRWYIRYAERGAASSATGSYASRQTFWTLQNSRQAAAPLLLTGRSFVSGVDWAAGGQNHYPTINSSVARSLARFSYTPAVGTWHLALGHSKRDRPACFLGLHSCSYLHSPSTSPSCILHVTVAYQRPQRTRTPPAPPLPPLSDDRHINSIRFDPAQRHPSPLPSPRPAGALSALVRSPIDLNLASNTTRDISFHLTKQHPPQQRSP